MSQALPCSAMGGAVNRCHRPLTPTSSRAASHLCKAKVPPHSWPKHRPVSWWGTSRTSWRVCDLYSCTGPCAENQGPVFFYAVALLTFCILLSLTLCSVDEVQRGSGVCPGGLEPQLTHSPATSLPAQCFSAARSPAAWHLRPCHPPHPCPPPSSYCCLPPL